MYVGVKLLHKHDGTPQKTLKKRFLASSLNDNGEKSVGKVQQNNMVLRMNATFLEVLREVLSGLLIMEPNVKKRDGIKRRRTRTLKRIPAQSGFMRFRCHSTVYVKERERERERKRENTSQPETKNRKEKKRYVCMNM